ncbi:MAG: RyR domain-containing protein [Planctomycetota bacterium]
MSLVERRAEFVYDAARLAAIAANAPSIPELWDDREEPFKAQFLEVIEKQCGPDRSNSPEELHRDWVEAYAKMGWVCGEVRDVEKKTHPDMVDYWALGHLERDKDAVFVALCEIARQWIYNDEPA